MCFEDISVGNIPNIMLLGNTSLADKTVGKHG